MEQKTIVLPYTQKVIEPRAFKGCRELKSIVIPDTVEEIGEDAFEGTGLEEIVFPRELRKLGRMNGCYCNLRKLDFSKVRHLEEFPSVFLSSDTPELTELVLPIGVKKVGEGIDGNLKKLFLPPTVQVLDTLYQSNLDIYCFAPHVEKLSPMIDEYMEPGEDVVRLFVLPEYLEAYRAQQAAEGVSAEVLVIDVVPEYYRHCYD